MFTDGTSIISNATCIDNNGRLLLIEYSSTFCCWEGLCRGQRQLYRSLVQAGRGRIVAALARHSDDVEVIDGTDVIAFQALSWDDEAGAAVCGPVRPGPEWVGFVEGLFTKSTPRL
jgi:hypothetical protein